MVNRKLAVRPQVIIFDCDGVLFDSRRANQIFYNHLLEHFGKGPLTEDDLNYVHMHTVGDSVAYLFKDEATRESADGYRKTLDSAPFLSKMEMEPGLIDFLLFIRPWSKTAICTNRTTTIGPLLKMYSLNDYFDLVVSALDVRQPKPHPESIYKILSFFKAKPEDCWYIGDSEVDALTAGKAGVPLVAFKNPALTADLHISGFPELKVYLNGKG